MADEQSIADELIVELADAAMDFAPFDATVFSYEARNELAEYRQRSIQRSVFTIPERYTTRAEVFVVFEVFVRHFIDPIVLAAELPRLLNAIDPEVKRLSSARFGEDERNTINIADMRRLSNDVAALTGIAANLGRDLFGDQFRSSDFWEDRG